jgi:hypothetical protein
MRRWYAAGDRHDARVTEDSPSGPFARLGRRTVGERLGGFIYGTILVLSVVIAGAKAYPDGPGHIAVFVVVTTGVFWLAHVYAHGLGEAVGQSRHLSFPELRRIARHEASIIEAGIPSVVALLLGAVGLFSADFAIWAAVVVGLAVLAFQGIVFARVERLSWLGSLAVVALNLGLGLILIALKLAVSH